MQTTPPSDSETRERSPELKIYFLPNLFTAGNLFCGFLALTLIVQAPSLFDEATFAEARQKIVWALELILLACILDVLDGRVARLGGYDSPFGREFDSLADVVSFGVAPAFLVYKVVLADVFRQNWEEIGWFIASIYVICGALRLARFNCLATMAESNPVPDHGREFMGFPIPAAAGLIASIAYFLIWFEEKDFVKSNWKFALPVLLLFLSAMMVSKVPYPTFKTVDWRARRSFIFMVLVMLALGFLVTLGRKALPVAMPFVFLAYLIYGFVRPWLSRRTRHEIEEGNDEHAGA